MVMKRGRRTGRVNVNHGGGGLSAGAVAAILLCPSADAAAAYRIEALDGLTSGPPHFIYPRSVNNAGVVAGDAQRALGGNVPIPPVRWDANTSIPTELG